MDANSSQITSTDSSSSPSPLWDVFLSFFGKDTRNNFTAHLYSALHQAAIRTYRDDPELKKGQEIPSGLLKAIQDSKASIVVLSQNYARSSWCLNELVEILACKKTKGMVVFPVFFHIDPSDIRSQKGSFGEALEIHKNKLCSVDKIEKWRDALTEIALLSGYHLGKESNLNESDEIQQIVKHVALQVSRKTLHLKKHLVGIDSVVEEIYEKLNMHSNDVRAIGICGMGGIGKTTIVARFFNRYSDRFDSSCIAESVKETLQGRHGLLALLNQLLAQLTRIKDFNVLNVESGISRLDDIFSSSKILVVLDDIDQSSTLKWLVQRCNLFSPESRIVMTTRDAHLLRRLSVDIYTVKKLGKNESLELFTCHAFGRTIPPEDFKELSEKFVNYAGGLPLALEVLGSSLQCRPMPFWQSKLEKVKEIPEEDIQRILKLSYDDLSDRTVKAIFLDIVFFFLGYNKDEAACVFDSCGFYPDIGIQLLVDKCLLTFQDNKLKMHNLIRDMGKEVIRQESEKGNSSRLWCRGNAFELFENQEATNKIEGLILDLTMWTKKHLSVKIFERMTNLRLLKIINAPHDFMVSFKNSFPELRYIHWHHCPWKRLPSTFRAQNLLFLDMQFSNMKTLWKDPMPLVNLKSINVSWSKCLRTTPNFSNVTMLEKLSLRCCWNLLEVHQSIGQLSKLSHLDLHACRNLKQFPEQIGHLEKLSYLDIGDCQSLNGFLKPIKQLTNLSRLDLSNCHRVEQLPEQVGDMKGLKKLVASYTSIKLLPDSICQLRHLEVLNLEGCNRLTELPEQIGNMEGLRKFNASKSAISQLPDSFQVLINLVTLELTRCENIRTLPNDIWKLSSLELLNLNFCSNLECLPEQLGKMQCLKQLLASGTAVEQLTDSIGQLSRLHTLNLSRCSKLENLPAGIWDLTSIKNLYLWDSGTLKYLPDCVENMKRVKYLSLRCDIRLCLPMILSFSSLKSLWLTDVGESLNSTKLFSLSKLSCLEYLTLWNRSGFGSSLPQLPLNLKLLSVRGYVSLEHLPDLSTFIHLETLRIYEYNSLQSLSLLPPHLQTLTIEDCASLRDLSELTTCNDSMVLTITNRGNLKFNAEDSFFQGHVIPMTKLPNWLTNKRDGRYKVCFDVPPMLLPNNPLGLMVWIVYRCKSYTSWYMRAVITNKRDGTKRTHYVPHSCPNEVSSGIICIYQNLNMIKYSLGDRIQVSLEHGKELDEREHVKVPVYIKVEKCRIRLLCKPISTLTSSSTTIINY